MMYSLDVIAAAKRVSDIFADGCDRCDFADLDLLHYEGLMTIGRVEHASDTLQEGDKAYFFNQAGEALVNSLKGGYDGD